MANICKAYHPTTYRRFNGKDYEPVVVNECWGIREPCECLCGGDESKCEHYPDKRDKAKRDAGISTTRHLIKEFFMIQINCTECQLPMLPSRFNTDKVCYESECPKCGKIVSTGDQPYPKTQYSFETKGEVIPNEI